jgi:hypothetical protein
MEGHSKLFAVFVFHASHSFSASNHARALSNALYNIGPADRDELKVPTPPPHPIHPPSALIWLKTDSFGLLRKNDKEWRSNYREGILLVWFAPSEPSTARHKTPAWIDCNIPTRRFPKHGVGILKNDEGSVHEYVQDYWKMYTRIHVLPI